MRFLIPPGAGTEDQSQNYQPCSNGRGHRPCHVGTVTLGLPGAKAPGQRPPRPKAGASRPPGRALASVGVGGTGLCGGVPRGRGKRMRFPRPKGQSLSPDREDFPGRQAVGLLFQHPVEGTASVTSLTLKGCAARPPVLFASGVSVKLPGAMGDPGHLGQCQGAFVPVFQVIGQCERLLLQIPGL